MSSINLATGFNNWNVSVEQGKALLTFFRDQQIQVLNELPTDKIHITVPKD